MAFRKWSVALVFLGASFASAGDFAAGSLPSPSGLMPVSGSSPAAGGVTVPALPASAGITTLPGQPVGVSPAPLAGNPLTGSQPYLAPSSASPIAGTQNPCCGPIGGDGPINYELYSIGGASFVFGSGALADALKTGWTVGVGARSLFFEPDGDAAWSVDLSGYYTRNEGTTPPPVVLNGGGRGSIFRLHRTAVGVGVGREWFSSLGFVGSPEGALRGGIDVGYRLGTGHADFRPLNDPTGYTRVHSIFGQAFVGGHISVDVPFGGWMLTTGIRTEWNHTHWRSIYPGGSNIQGLSVGLFVGFRF